MRRLGGNAAVRDRFSRETALWERHDAGTDIIGWERKRRFEITRETLKPYRKQPLRILEIGCGAGANIGRLIEDSSKWRGVGVDISPAMVATCKRRYRTARLSFATLDVTKRRLPGAFDVIILLGVVGYFDDNNAAFRNIDAMLRPGGLLLFTYGNRCSVFRAARGVGGLILDTVTPARAAYNALKRRLNPRAPPYDPAANKFVNYTERSIAASLGNGYRLVSRRGIGFTAGVFGRVSMAMGSILERIFAKHDPFSLAITRYLVYRKEKNHDRKKK